MKRTLLVLLTGCSMAHSEATLPAIPVAALTEDHFTRDHAGGISEDHLREVLAAPVFLEDGARLGVVPVIDGYAPDDAVPTVTVPASLVGALEDSGMFESASEVSTQWPTDRGLPGLRELAARYRTEYLLLYRHRFVTDEGHNGWAAGYATVIGTLFFPGQQIEMDGVLEATLYDVKTGTILFTANQRVHESQSAAPTTESRREHELEQKMLAEAGPKLADLVVSKCRRLAAARPPSEATSRLSSNREPDAP
jgi:hypothetical protein